MGRFLFTVLAAFLCSTIGCKSSTTSTTYFAVVDLDDSNAEMEYYRVKVKAKARNSQTLYQAGMYDAAALHDLYGSMSTPNQLMKANDSEETTSNSELVQNDFLDKRFTVIFGANADAIVRQMQLASENTTMGNSFGRLLEASVSGDLFSGNLKANTALAKVGDQNTKITAVLSLLAEDLAGAANEASAKQVLAKHATEVAKILNVPAEFDANNPDAAITLLTSVRDSIK